MKPVDNSSKIQLITNKQIDGNIALKKQSRTCCSIFEGFLKVLSKGRPIPNPLVSRAQATTSKSKGSGTQIPLKSILKKEKQIQGIVTKKVSFGNFPQRSPPTQGWFHRFISKYF